MGDEGSPPSALGGGTSSTSRSCLALLGAGGWPESIDHTDLHTGNCVVREDGSVLIFDWEVAVISRPFFSIEELTSRCGGRGEEVRAAYVEALPWRTRSERERAVDLGMELGLITSAHFFEVFHESFGFPGRSDRSAAMLAGHALGGWLRHG
ncbi:MAG: phosphotransferase [Chloroflexi bacterium]|nr:phosphotransferase [Chloroflexota bacterium]